MTARDRHGTGMTALAALASVLGLAATLQAAPPPKPAGLAARATDVRGVPGGVVLASRRLDLAAPAVIGTVRTPPGAFSALMRHDESPATPPGTAFEAAFGAPSARFMSRAELMAHNFRREGLPVAKLFQSEDALVHVGLNPKGKPGLWIVKKLH